MEKPVKSHVHIFVSRSLLARKRKTFTMTKRKNSSFKRTLPQLLNTYTLDAIAFCTMVKFTVSSKHETLPSLHGCKN